MKIDTYNSRDDAFTIDDLREAIRRVRAVRTPIYAGFTGLPVVVSEHLAYTVPRADFTWWERVRLWLERLTDAAELLWPWSRVRRSEYGGERDPYLIDNRLLAVGPRTFQAMRRANMVSGTGKFWPALWEGR